MSTERTDPGVYDYSLRPARPPRPIDHGNEDLPIPLDTRIDMYRMQQEIRQFEKRAYDLFMQNLVKGTSHLSLGQEAVAAGVAAAMRPDDYTFATYRGHAHTLARGAAMGPTMAELLGREDGILGGKGGSMHLTAVEHGMMGSYAIVGAHLCVANGAAWSAQLRSTEQVTVAFFGDGTTNIGAFHEALNFAVVWKLPVIFICENNLYMEYTPIDFVTAVPHPAADRASAYGLEPVLIDGNDADAVFAAAAEVIARARHGEGPALIEAITYRHGGHSRADPGAYRPEDEVDAWVERDPIPMYHQRLLRLGVAEGDLVDIEQAVAKAVDDATEFAKASAPPGEDVLMTEVWADGGSAWRN